MGAYQISWHNFLDILCGCCGFLGMGFTCFKNLYVDISLRRVRRLILKYVTRRFIERVHYYGECTSIIEKMNNRNIFGRSFQVVPSYLVFIKFAARIARLIYRTSYNIIV